MAVFRSNGIHVLAAMVCFLFVNMVPAATIKSPHGFSIKMIPRYSRNSPGSPGNLTDKERYGLMLQSSQRRANALATVASTYAIGNSLSNSNGTLTHPDIVSAAVSQVLDSQYVVQVGIGTPPTTFYLLLDTGSRETWVQTKYCSVCFPYKHDPYDFDRSSSYQWMHCDHPNCAQQRCINDLCVYNVHYVDKSKSISIGIHAMETFTVFSADSNSNAAIRNVIFGCGLKNFAKWGKNSGPGNEIAGVFGMGQGPWSFVSQLNMTGQEGSGRFSYCLTHWNSPGNVHNLLKFGNSASIPRGAPVSTTPLISGPVKDFYYVNLRHISVSREYLDFPLNLFLVRSNGTGGMIVDSGSAFTYLYTPAFKALVERIMEIFQRAGMSPTPFTRPKWSDLQFCWTVKSGAPVPKIVFHFDGGALFEPNPEAVFMIDNDVICLQMFSTDELAILGAFTMTNYIFHHDIVSQSLSFAKQDCTSY